MELEKWGLRKKIVRCLPVGEIRDSSDRSSAGDGLLVELLEDCFFSSHISDVCE